MFVVLLTSSIPGPKLFLMHPVLIFLLLVGGLLFISWCKRQPPAVRNKAIVYVAVAVILLLVLTGRMHWLMGLIGAGIAMFQRVMMASQLFNRFKSMSGMGGPSPGKSSSIETRFLRMSLDHDSGDLSGEVLIGRFKGKGLHDLEMDDLLHLLGECRAEDHQSVAVLESYLEQRFSDQWSARAGAGTGSGPARSNMTREEAMEILGVAIDASKEDIIQAHRRLMQRLHPDRGGSTYLAAKINQAKDLLLGA